MCQSFIFSAILTSVISASAFAQSNPYEYLQRGMEMRSDSLMQNFFEAWFDSSNVIRKQAISNLERDAEDVVMTIWNPSYYSTFVLGLPKDSSHPRYLPPYIVLPHIIRIYSNAYRNIPVDSLQGIFPSSLFGSKVLFYNQRFINETRKFLMRRNLDDTGNQEYLEKFVTVSCHMGGCSVIGSPTIGSIVFRDNTAIVDFSLGGEGFEVTLLKASGKWKVVKREMKWIE